jgi:hypothetical protein
MGRRWWIAGLALLILGTATRATPAARRECDKSVGHKSLLSCDTDGHAAT